MNLLILNLNLRLGSGVKEITKLKKDETWSQSVTRTAVDCPVFSLVLMYDEENNLGFADDYQHFNTS